MVTEFQLNIQLDILALTILIPIIGAICIAIIDKQNAKCIAVWCSSFVLLLCSWLCVCIDKSQCIHILFWQFSGSINAISAYMSELASIAIFSGLITSSENESFSASEFFIAMLLIQAALTILFFNTDIFLFAFAFEAIVILASYVFVYFDEDYRAFFMLTSAAAFMIFFCSVCVLNTFGTCDVQILKQYSFSRNHTVLILLCAAFAIVYGLFPFCIREKFLKIPYGMKSLIFGIFLAIGLFGFIAILLPLSRCESYRSYIIASAIISTVLAIMKTYKKHSFESLSECTSYLYSAIMICGIFSLKYRGVTSAIFGSMIYFAIFIGASILLDEDSKQKFKDKQISYVQLIAITVFVLCGICAPIFPGFTFLFSTLESISDQKTFFVIFAIVLLVAEVNLFSIFNNIVNGVKLLPLSKKDLYQSCFAVPLLIFILYAGFFPSRILVSLEDSVQASLLQANKLWRVS